MKNGWGLNVVSSDKSHPLEYSKIMFFSRLRKSREHITEQSHDEEQVFRHDPHHFVHRSKDFGVNAIVISMNDSSVDHQRCSRWKSRNRICHCYESYSNANEFQISRHEKLRLISVFNISILLQVSDSARFLELGRLSPDILAAESASRGEMLKYWRCLFVRSRCLYVKRRRLDTKHRDDGHSCKIIKVIPQERRWQTFWRVEHMMKTVSQIRHYITSNV